MLRPLTCPAQSIQQHGSKSMGAAKLVSQDRLLCTRWNLSHLTQDLNALLVLLKRYPSTLMWVSTAPVVSASPFPPDDTSCSGELEKIMLCFLGLQNSTSRENRERSAWVECTLRTKTSKNRFNVGRSAHCNQAGQRSPVVDIASCTLKEMMSRDIGS